MFCVGLRVEEEMGRGDVWARDVVFLYSGFLELHVGIRGGRNDVGLRLRTWGETTPKSTPAVRKPPR